MSVYITYLIEVGSHIMDRTNDREDAYRIAKILKEDGVQVYIHTSISTVRM